MLPRTQWVRRPGLRLRTLALAIVLAAIPGWAETTSNPIAPVATPDADCSAWPGEPEPLPAVDDANPFRRAWAEARVGELARLGRALEGLDRVEASRFWQHAACIAPQDEGVRDGLARAVPRAVHRPEPTTRSALAAGDPGPAVGLDAALDIALSEPALAVPLPTRVAAIERNAGTTAARQTPRDVPDAATEEAPAVSAPPPAPVRFEHTDAIAQLLQQARFRHALERAENARSALADETGRDARAQLAQVEVLAATAEVALGNPSEAERHFRSALDADPKLELDASHPPKVQRIFESAREEQP